MWLAEQGWGYRYQHPRCYKMNEECFGFVFVGFVSWGLFRVVTVMYPEAPGFIGACFG